MRVPEVLFFYVLMGLAVAGYAYRQTGEVGAVATLLWPLWLPVMLAPDASRYDTAHVPETAPSDEVDRLEKLFSDWDPSLVPPTDALRRRLGEMRQRQLALHEELSRPENDLGRLRLRAGESSTVGHVYRRRLQNVEAMSALHDQLQLEARTALARVEELCSRVQLARFRGATVEGVGVELSQLVAAIEGAREIEALSR